MCTCSSPAQPPVPCRSPAQIKIFNKRIGDLLDTHADAHLFTSLPGSGTNHAARLFNRIGDCRPESPPRSTRVPGRPGTLDTLIGQTHVVGFRWARDRELRDAVCDSTRGLPARRPRGAASIYNRAIARNRLTTHQAHPGPRLSLRNLALPADPHRLRHRQPPRSSSPVQPARTIGGLTEGNHKQATSVQSNKHGTKWARPGLPRPHQTDPAAAPPSRTHRQFHSIAANRSL